MEDHLAEWISEYPSLVDMLAGRHDLEAFLRRRPVRHNERKVSDEEWASIVLTLES